MAVLSESQRARVQWVVDYLEAGGGAPGTHSVAGNQKVAEELDRAFCDLCPGWFDERCAGNFQQALHNSPVTTLLKIILCVNDSCI